MEKLNVMLKFGQISDLFWFFSKGCCADLVSEVTPAKRVGLVISQEMVTSRTHWCGPEELTFRECPSIDPAKECQLLATLILSGPEEKPAAFEELVRTDFSLHVVWLE